MTPVDALDTLILMGFHDEADAARELIATKLDFDQDIYVKNFEITIRLLGGLLSGYQMTGDERLLKKAEDLGRRLLPVFDSPTGFPYVEVNLRTGSTRGTKTNPAETGTLLLEFGTLSKLTGKAEFYEKAKRALVETWKRRSSIGLVGEEIDAESGKWTSADSHVSGGIDSYYEYLWKCGRLFGDEDCVSMWITVRSPRYTAISPTKSTAHSGTATRTCRPACAHTRRSARSNAFFPALLAMSGDVPRAARVQDSGVRDVAVQGHRARGIRLYKTRTIPYPGYALRPEIVESTYHLAHYTHDDRYLVMGRTMFRDFVRWCRTDAGYAALSDVVSKTKKDRMESYVLAETFKYYYLLFAPQAIDFDAVTFNTEAHPLRAVSASSARAR